MRIHHPGEEAVTLETGVLLINLQRALHIVGDVFIAKRRAWGTAGLPGPAPVQLTDLKQAVVSTAIVLSRGVEAGFVVGDAHPRSDMVSVNAKDLQVAREFAPIVNVRASERGQRTRQQREGEHRKVRLRIE
ncbi:jg689 [Pararge aegeria aegeria]|uniref:Jg689 protein n=1 Tax=Pararge aegeria aegeria TaxID=348720 RepID=A0A8S4RCC0_9NEOP|nr:jg689 [Pararge aegeria aegeria]